MKLRLLLMVFLVAIGLKLTAQPLHWTESLFDPTKASTVLKEAVLKTEGNNSMKYTYTDPGTVYLYSDTLQVTAGEPYSFSIDVYDNDPQATISVRLWFYTGVAGSAYLSRTETTAITDQAGWQTRTLTGTTPAGATIAYIGIRMRATTAASFTSATFYADNVIYNQGSGSTVNMMPNPGFEQWYIAPGSSLNDWTESLFDPTKTSTVVPESTLKTEGYNSVKYTYTDPGTVYLYCDTIAVTAGEPYNFSIDVYDNDPQATISTRLWFYTGVAGSAYLTRTETAAITDQAGWQTRTLTGTVPATATIAYVGIRMRATTAASFTSATFYADNAIFTQGASSTTNLINNGGFENWTAPTNAPEFSSFKFEGLTPNVVGVINKMAHTVELTVPYVTDLTALVATFTMPDGVTAKVGTTDQVSGTTPNDFTASVTYTLAKGAVTQDWVVTVNKVAPTTGKDIVTFKFSGLNPEVVGEVVAASHAINLTVPFGTPVSALVATFTLSPNATAKVSTVDQVSGTTPNNYTNPVTYTITAQDASTQDWVVTVTFEVAGQTTLFLETFEGKTLIPSTWVLKNNDGYTQYAGEERWQDSAWVVSSTSRPELVGTKIAAASSFCANMPLDGKADDWMILPSITLGDNSTLSWQAMSLTVSGNYPDDYMVLIAPAIDGTTPSVAYFESEGNILQTIAPENWSASVSRAGAGLASRSINLKNKVTPSAPNGWFSRKVWIAFVLTTDRYTNPSTGIPNTTAGGSELGIDNIKVVNNPLTGIEDNRNSLLNVSIFPNPTTGKFKISMQLERNAIAEVAVTDIIGRLVYSNKIPVKSGLNSVDINLSDLHEGIYLVKTNVNGKSNVSKLIVK
jgi:hypothetical protein